MDIVLELREPSNGVHTDGAIGPVFNVGSELLCDFPTHYFLTGTVDGSIIQPEERLPTRTGARAEHQLGEP